MRTIPANERSPPRAKDGSWAWMLLGGALLLASLGVAVWGRPGFGASAADSVLQGPLAWRVDRLAGEPWRLWTAAFVHLSGLHLAANVAGGVGVLALGRAARLPAAAAWAWLLAWPLTHLGLLASPSLVAYAGLSGVLHAGVACAALGLILAGSPAASRSDEAGRGPALAVGRGRERRRLGWAVLAVLGVKVLLERPWAEGGGARWVAGWDIPVAPAAHGSGVLAGVVASLVVAAVVGAARARGRLGT